MSRDLDAIRLRAATEYLNCAEKTAQKDVNELLDEIEDLLEKIRELLKRRNKALRDETAACPVCMAKENHYEGCPVNSKRST